MIGVQVRKCNISSLQETVGLFDRYFRSTGHGALGPLRSGSADVKAPPNIQSIHLAVYHPFNGPWNNTQSHKTLRIVVHGTDLNELTDSQATPFPSFAPVLASFLSHTVRMSALPVSILHIINQIQAIKHHSLRNSIYPAASRTLSATYASAPCGLRYQSASSYFQHWIILLSSLSEIPVGEIIHGLLGRLAWAMTS